MMVGNSVVLEHWNELAAGEAAREILPCCGSLRWAERMSARRPFASTQELIRVSDAVWEGLSDHDWQQAFDSHPRIGQRHARAATATSLAWSSEEQHAAASSENAAKIALAEANLRYEEKFGRIFIICATGKSSEEILSSLVNRMHNSTQAEILESAEQQRQVTHLRLRRWLGISS